MSLETPEQLTAEHVAERNNDIARMVTGNSVNTLERTETAKSLRQRGLSVSAPAPDINYPTIGGENPQFPEEYTIETETGLVPQETIRSIRSVPQNEAPESFSDVEKNKEPVEFVTFTLNDPQNPQNWSLAFRCYTTFAAAFLVIAVAFSSANVTGGLGLIQEKYGVSMEVANLTCSITVLGFAVGPLLWSPMSELIGRQPVYFISLLLFLIFVIPVALAPNIGAFLTCRFLCGVFASSGLTLAGGTISDVWKKETRGASLALFSYAPYSGPCLGPLICGWINVKTHRLDVICWMNMAVGGIAFILIMMVPETYAPVILKRRAKKLRKETGNPSIITEQELNKPSLGEIIQVSLLRPMVMIFTEPVLDLMCLYIVLIYAMLYAFFFAFPVIFNELYGYDDGIIGLMFIPILIGATFALGGTLYCEKKFRQICMVRDPTPEDRLLGALIGAPFPAIALWILGATAQKSVIWVGPASAGLAFGFGMVLIYYSVNNYIIDSYTKYAASALAAKVFLRSGGGAAFPLFTVQMYHKLGLHWASWLLAFICSAMILIPVVFYRFGAAIRKRLNKS